MLMTIISGTYSLSARMERGLKFTYSWYNESCDFFSLVTVGVCVQCVLRCVSVLLHDILNKSFIVSTQL